MVRDLAVDALEKMRKSQCMAQEAVYPLLLRRNLSEEDQGFLWELVHGVTRHRDTLDVIIKAFSKVKIKKVYHRVLMSLRVAIYQMVYLDRIPHHAAVYEAVENVKGKFEGWVVRYTNGCLRNISRDIEIKVGGEISPEDVRRAVPIGGERNCLFLRTLFPDPREDLAGSLAERHSHPLWLVDRLLDEFDEDTVLDILRAGNEPPSLWLRPTPGHAEALSREFGKRGIAHELKEGAIRLLQAARQIPDLPGFDRGWFVVQDRAAMRAAPLLDPRPGDRILDLCAAPGGKTMHLAALAGPTARIVAVDRDPRRLRRLQENALRLKIENVEPVTGDGRDLELDLGEPFDRVLVDVPCSNTAVLAKRAEARHRISPELLDTLTVLQREILASGATRLRPGGVLVYSTCALLEEENQDAVADFLEDHPDFSLEDERLSLPIAGYSDGGYLARLHRLAPPETTA
jgi:16S rRNA (cytosine967-C5)-methyltransferase